MVPGVSRAIYEPGGLGCRRDTHGIERVNVEGVDERITWMIQNSINTSSATIPTKLLMFMKYSRPLT